MSYVIVGIIIVLGGIAYFAYYQYLKSGLTVETSTIPAENAPVSLEDQFKMLVDKRLDVLSENILIKKEYTGGNKNLFAKMKKY
jgi:hypothetical protein